MAQKWQTISELAAETSRKVTHSPEEWCRFLTTAARFYKAYDFDDQLLIYAQKPNATACADMPTWNNKMRRWVNAGSTAIALIRKGYGGKPYLDYVHDVADTHPVRGGKDPWLWKLTEENREPVMERLRDTFGIDGSGDLGDLLMETAEKLVQESYGEYLPDLLYEREDSFLEELDDFNVEVLFRNTLRASVQYAVLSRCGLDVSRYLDAEDFREITNFNTTAALACLGTAVSQGSRELLLEIGDTIRKIEREKAKNSLAKSGAEPYNDKGNFSTLKRERSNTHGDIDIQQTERVSSAQSPDGRGGERAADPGPVRKGQGEISDGAPQGTVQFDAADREAVGTSDRDRPDSPGADGQSGGRNGEGTGRDRSPESQQPDRMGAADEQHSAVGGGDYPKRPDLQLNPEETAGEQPAVSASVEMETPFFTKPDYRQLTLFDLPEMQIQKISHQEAEAAASASSRSRRRTPEQPKDNKLEAASRKLFEQSGTATNEQLSFDFIAAGRGQIEPQNGDSQGTIPPPQVPSPEPTGAGASEAVKPSTEAPVSPSLVPDVPEYMKLKADHPGSMVSVRVGDYFLLYGEDAKQVAADLGLKTVVQEIPGLGETTVTGTNLGWPHLAKHILQVDANLVDYAICYLVDGVQVHQDKYETLSDLIDQELSALDFDNLIRTGMDAIPEEPVAPDLTGQPVTREGDTLTIGNGPATHEVDITVSDEEWEQIKEAIPDQQEKQPQVTTETEVVYSGEKNRLPFDVVIEKLHIEEPERISTPAVQNFHITDPDLGAGGQKTKYQNNVAAIRLLKDLEAQGRSATPEEQEVLSRYVGWGGIPQAFDETNEKWASEYAELKTLLTPEEYASARGSTLNAHFTSPTVIEGMYQALEQMGVHPDTVLEPAMGVGNFFGLMPESMQNATLMGVELDSITGRLAKQLYPQANITVDGFERVNLPDNSIDLAVGNVPFGSYKLADPRYDKQNLLIHDYFFVKTLDKVRPGGIVAFITSKGTLDKQDSTVREYLAQRADLLGAVRLPNNAFSRNAGTDVTTDILFLQKRAQPPEQVPDWVHLGQTADGIPINRYFETHPDMVLGTMAWDKSMYGNEWETTCAPIPGIELADQLSEALSKLSPPDQQLLSQKGAVEVQELLERMETADVEARNFSYTEVGGKLYFVEDGERIPVEVPATTEKRIRGMIGLRGVTRNLIELQLYGGTDEEIRTAQEKLGKAYDAYTAEYGLLNSTGNKRAFEQDSSYCLLCSLEILDEDGNLERKADMFTKRTINQQVTIDHVDTASEALAVSIGERARVDLDYMASLLGTPGETDSIIRDLKGVIYKNPEAGGGPLNGWETADEYLSGNVRKKLAAARAAAENDPIFAENVAALEQAQPKDLSAAEIDVRIGVTWIDPQYYTQFVHELLKPPFYLKKDIQVRYSPATGEWNVSGKSRDSLNNSLAYVTYGTKRRNAYAIIEDSLNLRDTRIYDTVHNPDGTTSRVFNAKETMLAQQKQEQIREAFKDWIWKDPARRADLCQKYNELYNAIRPRSYNGEHIRFSGMNPEISLRPHQRNAVARMLYGGNSLLAHCVGAGKTFEIVAAAMESKRLGLAKKSLVVVPNHLTEQWGADFLRLYPGANVLVATKKDFEPANRKKFCSRIATGDYDAVVIGHSQFEKIPLSPERQKAILQEQIDQVIDGIQEAKAQDGERYTIKQLEKSRKNLETRMKKLNDQSRKDDVITFEELGVDKLFVDEAHGFKNLFLATKMRNVAGIGQSEAQKSSDMFAKCRYLDEITGGRGVVFATGTPVSNSMVELYTMMRYLQYDLLKSSGLEHFDSWAANFGETITALEMAPEGTGFRSKTRFAKFFNLPELMAMWREAADIQTADMLRLPVPAAEKITEVTTPSDFQRDLVADLGERAEAVRNREVEPREDNMLKITSDGRKLALDQRLSDPTLPDDPESKVNACVRNVLQVWQDTEEIKGTQLVFCDLSTPKGDGSFNVYDDMKQKMMAQGVPPEEIAFIHDAKTEVQKAELFAKVRKGQVRVLLGSTAKMGAGTNVQTRLTALHHLDCPWRPADIEQREGRILRQGNMNQTVKIYKYVTENTFDAYNWSILENKQKFIGQLMSGKNPSRSCEDVDEAALSYAEVKALASGDPRIIEMTDLDSQVTKLKLLKANHEGQRYMLEDRLIQFFPKAINGTKEQIQGLEGDLAVLQAHPQPDKEHFSITVAGQTYTERKAAGQAIIDACTKMTDVSQRVELGEYRGFPMTLWADTATQKFQVTMKQNLSHTIELGSDPVGNIARLDNALAAIAENLEQNKGKLENLTAQMEEAKLEVKRPFPQEQELVEKTSRLNVLRIALNMDGKSTGKRERDKEELDGGKPSIKGMLKRLGVESAATASPPQKDKDMEVAI